MIDRLYSALLGAQGVPSTHMHVIGSSGAGKSKFLEYFMRQGIFGQHGDCGFGLIDWHGGVYDDLVDHLALVSPRLELYLFDPSRGERITRYNPFQAGDRDIGVAANRFVDITVKAWGAEDTNTTPRLARVARALFHFALATGETLPNARNIFRRYKPEMFRYAASVLQGPEHREAFDDLMELEKMAPGRFDELVQSTNNRLSRFLSNRTLSYSIGLKGSGLSVQDILNRNAILLVNLKRSARLDEESARVIGAFLLSDFIDAAIVRGKTDEHFILVLDEFQEFITPDMAKMLDQARKGGLHLVMAHQRMTHLEKSPELQDAVLSNARIKAAFAVERYDTAYFMAPELCLSEMNENKVKDEIVLPVTIGHQQLETRARTSFEAQTTGKQRGLSFFDGKESPRTTQGDTNSTSTGESETIGSTFLAILEERPVSRTFYSLEEKRNFIAQKLRDLPDRHAIVRIKGRPAEVFVVPDMTERNVVRQVRQSYEEERGAIQNDVSPDEAERLIEEDAARFIDQVARTIEEERERNRTQRQGRIPVKKKNLTPAPRPEPDEDFSSDTPPKFP